MGALVLVNGAPGVGKSTVVHTLVAHRPLALALDIDQIRHSLGGWADDVNASGLQARRIALAMAGRHLQDGHDVLVGQYVARTEFIEQLNALAVRTSAHFIEVLLTLDLVDLQDRLRRRQEHPDRPEHAVNNRLVGPRDVAELVLSLEALPHLRPGTISVDASGTVGDVADRLEALRAQLP